MLPMTSVSEWLDAIADAPTEGCLDLPEQATPVSAAEVSRSQRISLHDAVAGLLRAYAENSPELMIQYLAAHGARFSSQRIDQLRDPLRKVLHLPQTEIDKLTADQVYVNFWREPGVNPHISGILKESGCIGFWRYSELPTEELLNRSFGAYEGLVFQNIEKQIPTFEPVRPLERVLQSDGSVLYADVKVLVQLDAELYHQVVPYFLRFWYDSVTDIWYPSQLARVTTVSGRGMIGGQGAPLIF
jgi:hypothetical protein